MIDQTQQMIKNRNKSLPILCTIACALTYCSLHTVKSHVLIKEIVERRHGEPIKFLFLPKMGLLGSQAGNEKIEFF
jgi:hypothetical protein